MMNKHNDFIRLYIIIFLEAIWQPSGDPRFGRFAALSNVFWVVLAWFDLCFETPSNISTNTEETPKWAPRWAPVAPGPEKS